MQEAEELSDEARTEILEGSGEAEPEEAEPQEARQQELGIGDAEAQEELLLMEDLDRKQEDLSEHGVLFSASVRGLPVTSQRIVIVSEGPLLAALPEESAHGPNHLDAVIVPSTSIMNIAVQGMSHHRFQGL